MERRTFLASAIGPTLMAAAGAGSSARPSMNEARQSGTGPGAGPELYLWRQYTLRTGTQLRRLADFLQNAAIPALNRLGHRPIGVFEVQFGLPTPGVFVLIPSATADRLATLDAALDKDDAYVKASEPYVGAAATDPVYVRQEVALLGAFANVPRIEVPQATAAGGPRLFELRTYESHNERAHRMKVRMFAELGEVDIFRRVGLTPVFFARTLAGPKMPSLVYLLVHENMAARERSWGAFRDSPDWKKLSATPGYSDPEIVTNITTVFLRPAAYSQV